MNQKKNVKGFTLIELVIVIVIVGILSAVSVPIYKSYTRKAMASEGRALMAAVANAQKVWYAEHSTYTTVTGAAGLNIDCSTNKYFRSIVINNAGAAQWDATAAGSGDAAGINVTATGANNAAIIVAETGI
jgi:prepilin-type N-terminal cleavage/methylation domain-containing protein